VTTKEKHWEDALVVNPLLRRALAGVGLLLAALSTQAHAQSTPKTVTLIVPFAAGGGTDTVARLIGERMSRTLGQTVIIENVVGGGSTLANDRVARSAPDGSTVLINHVALLAAPSLFTDLRYDTKTAFEPVGLVNNAPMVLIGRKSIPGAGPKDFVDWIKAQGDKANFAHGGLGTNSHLCAVMMGNVLGFKPTVAAYRGSAPAISDLLGGADRSALGSGDQRAAADSGRNTSRHRHYVVRTARTVEGRADHRRARHA
jgi:tripartite-type tricarboxylate transporter receptor subunit TctC